MILLSILPTMGGGARFRWTLYNSDPGNFFSFFHIRLKLNRMYQCPVTVPKYTFDCAVFLFNLLNHLGNFNELLILGLPKNSVHEINWE